MKNFIYSGSLLIVALFFSATTTEANWLNPRSTQSVLSNTLTNQTQQDKSDSLPSGVTQDWLNSLKDENGNPIINSKQTEEEGDALQRKIFNGLVSGSQFGFSVNSAGDVNGDGYDDVIVGAFSYSSYTGRAYIYYGDLNMNAVPDLVMTGEAANNFFGVCVSSAGDVNGDGYSDVIIGANGYATNTGRAYIYFGGSSMNNSADVIMTGEATNNHFGRYVSTAGDANGDGYSDVIVGAWGYSSNTGRAYIYFGSASMNLTADVTMTGEFTTNSFGISVSSAGDVNGDGYSDVIVGAHQYSSDIGRAYIYFGGASMNNTADVTMTGEAITNYFGYSVSSTGDINGDGYSDVIVGAYGYSSNTGRAYIYFGGASMNNTADVTMTGEATNNYFGRSVSTAGDINGDGYSDVIAGAYGYSFNTGRVYIFFGGTSMNNMEDFTITGEATNNYFGGSVSPAGDVNGDGYSDVIVGAYGYSSFTGRAYLYDYFMRNEIVQDLAMTGEATNNLFGGSVSSAGDVNGDGYDDVIVGAIGYSSSTGRVYIYFGGASMNNTADVTMTGEAISNFFGRSVSSAGDVNGDGYSDVIVGADSYSFSTGRAYIYFGGTSMNNAADVTMTGDSASIFFGCSVSSAGDVNGDGYSDVIVGARLYSNSKGRAYVYFGGASMNDTADVTLTGEASFNYFGGSVSSAGDVNSDGYSDVIVSSWGYFSYTGRAYIYFGGASMNNNADVIMTGEPNSYFGCSVSSAGDVNRDGYSDVIVGAYTYTPDGAAFIFFGGATVNNTADVTVTGEAGNNSFGYSVSTAGDLNSDGYDDVIVGARSTTSTGKSYVYFGGALMDNMVDVTMTGEAANNYFGYSVSSAGDVNGDGYSDVIVGASQYSSHFGRAYIYTGSAISAKPVLIHVKDVPNDQGGQLNLKWARSSFDVQGTNLITDYVIQRSYPPSGGNFSWENIAYIPATVEQFYSYTDNTPYDSTTNNVGTLYYRITARTSIASQYWRSAILSGHSIDNIAPLMVSPFTASPVSNDVKLNWGRSSSSDLLNYILYRSTSPTIDPDTEPVFATTTDSTYLDTSPLNGLYYYFIVAQDIHNNKSPVAVVESPHLTLNLTALVEGFYDDSSNAMVMDTMRVYLRNNSSPYAIVDSAISYLSNSGTGSFAFTNASDGTPYYIHLYHRNSIETWSNTPQSFVNSALTYDFTTASTKAYGNNMPQVDASPVKFAIYSGDVNQDGVVELSDIVLAYNDAQNFVSGYVKTDLNGDDFVDLTDITIAFNNSNLFVSRNTP